MTATNTGLEIAGKIELRLKAVRRGLGEAREALKQVEAEEKSLTTALRALNPGSDLLVKAEQNGHVPVAPAAKTQKKAITPSPKMVERVYEALVYAAPMTAMELSKILEVSDSYVRAALKVLRADGRVRLTGSQGGPGAPRMFTAVGDDA